jgi:hypothetical protein
MPRTTTESAFQTSRVNIGAEGEGEAAEGEG